MGGKGIREGTKGGWGWAAKGFEREPKGLGGDVGTFVLIKTLVLSEGCQDLSTSFRHGPVGCRSWTIRQLCLLPLH